MMSTQKSNGAGGPYRNDEVLLWMQKIGDKVDHIQNSVELVQTKVDHIDSRVSHVEQEDARGEGWKKGVGAVVGVLLVMGLGLGSWALSNTVSDGRQLSDHHARLQHAETAQLRHEVDDERDHAASRQERRQNMQALERLSGAVEEAQSNHQKQAERIEQRIDRIESRVRRIGAAH